MERVQYSLERSLPQLKLLDEQGLLSKEELRSISSQRQGFEARLIRRKPAKRDFERYLAFETDLNDLILLRARARSRLAAEQIRKHGGDNSKARLLPRNFFGRQAASHFAQCISVYERMVRKFRYDVDCWSAYLAWARSKKMRVVAGRVYARNADTTAARALLQRGLRMNPLVDADAISAQAAQDARGPKVRRTARGAVRAVRDPGLLRWELTEYEHGVLRLWVEYFRMELVFMERLRRRWRILGLDSGSGDAPVPQGGDAFTTARATAHTVAPEDHGVGEEEGEEVEADVEQDVPPAPAPAPNDKDEFATERVAPNQGIEVPEGHKQIMDGTIPLVLLANARKSLPPTVQLYFFVAILGLLSAFPFFDSSIVREQGALLSLRLAQTPLGSGDMLRNRLIRGVLDTVQETCKTSWSEEGRLATAMLTSLHPFMHPFSALELDLDGMPASLADTELEKNGLLHGASQLHTTFSRPIDALYDLARIPDQLRSTGSAGANDPWHACRPVLFLLNVLSERLVERAPNVEPAGDDESIASDVAEQAPTQFLAAMAASGNVPSMAAALVAAFRAHDEENVALGFLATLQFLSSKAAIEEQNILAYFAHVEATLVAELLDTQRADLAWLAVQRLERKLEACDGDADAIAQLDAEAQALRASCTNPGALVLYERIGAQAAERLFDSPHSAAFAFTWQKGGMEAAEKARGAWRVLLRACTSPAQMAQDAGAPVWAPLIEWLGAQTDAALVASAPARRALWLDYLAWAHSAAVVPAADGKEARKKKLAASHWSWETHEAAVVETGALLASSQLVGTARLEAQALHDAVVEQFALFSSTDVATLHDAERDASKRRALQSIFERGSPSIACVLELALRESTLLTIHTEAAAKGIQERTLMLYRRALDMAERTDADIVHIWTLYLAFLLEIQDMRTVMEALQRAQEHVAAFAPPGSVHALEQAWHSLLHARSSLAP
ncbi:U3 snoRNP protein [Malassezia vespertilionis]|uniref:U3 snoRNP protein n=1 Tax=Malassezia vespertilionis TaxID=2020962 RepID=UPI0024B097C5|nr:U3 snoRNP protein [Malassezia vespertilionis]WFD05768.1 U3 snoRNP protein [Malassezia vespertilionis]